MDSNSKSEMIKFKSMLKDLGWKYKDVADRSGLTVGTVRVRLSQGLPSWMRLALAVYHSTKRKYDIDVRERMKEIFEDYDTDRGKPSEKYAKCLKERLRSKDNNIEFI